MKQFTILIIRFSSLGDIILNSSILGALKFFMGSSVKVVFLTSKPFDDLLINHPLIDKVYGFERKKSLLDLARFVDHINSENQIDLIMDFHSTIRSLFIRLYLWSTPRVFVDKRTVERFILTFFKFDILSSQYRNNREKGYGELLLKRNISDFSPLWNKFSDKKLDFDKLSVFIKPDNKSNQLSSCNLTYRDMSLDIKDLSDKYIVFVPSASFVEKRWPKEKFKDLLTLCLENERLSSYQMVITAGPGDDFCDEFNDLKNTYKKRFLNLQGKTGLKETVGLVKGARLCVGNDTGVPHFAESVGTPCIFILGPTGQEFGFYPHLEKSKVISLDLWCRPCTTNGKGNCIRSKRFCLEDISPERVYGEIIQSLEVAL